MTQMTDLSMRHSMPDTRHISVTYDPEAQVWWAESDDIPGLVTEASTLDALVERAEAAAIELLAISGAHGRVYLQFNPTRQVEMA
jgi:predicted RNase H-like HicB family nuclease